MTVATKADRTQLLDQGFVIYRNVIPPEKLDRARAAYEVLVERQKEIWARERKPEDPPLAGSGKRPGSHACARSID